MTLWVKYPLDMFVRLVTDVLNTCQVHGIKDRQVVSWTKATTKVSSAGQTVVQLNVTDAQYLSFQGTKV